MLKSIMIFGAGDNQLTLIKAARELGVKSIVIDPNDDAPGKVLADVFEVVSSKNYDKTKEIAIKYNVDGIVTSQMENPLRLMAKLAADMKFIFPSPVVIERCRNKYLMKQAFIEHAIPCARGILVKDNDKITLEKLADFRFPLIIKPTDAHSSRGVFKIMNFEELLKFENDSRNFASDKSVIIEEFIEGPEYSIEAVTFKGKTHIIQYTEKIITPFPHTVELGHIQPAELTDSQMDEINSIVTKSIKALGIENSATHTELKLTLQGPVIIEIGARLGGDYISSYLTLASTGVNMDKAAIQIALGISPEITPNGNAFSCIKYIELNQGLKVTRLGNWKEVLNTKDVIYGSITIREGDIVPPVTDSAKRPGFVLVSAPTRDEVLQNAEIACKSLTRYINLIEYHANR